MEDKARKYSVIAFLVALVLSGCSTLVYTRTPQTRVYTDAVYQSSKPFFFFGLVGGPHDVYADQVCLKKDVDQVSTEYTPSDILVGLFTLGIYTPRTVKLWCQI